MTKAYNPHGLGGIEMNYSIDWDGPGERDRLTELDEFG